MEIPDNETTQAIDLATLRGEGPRKPKKEKLDLYEVPADSVFGDSLPGLVRVHNEDCYACCCKPDGHLTLAVVADGIGGGDHGEVASAACITEMIRSWREFSSRYQDTTWENAQEHLAQAILEANKQIYKKGQALGVHMGTTIAALQFADRYAVIANAGDSRVYRFRNNELEQLSTDHTLVAEELAKGKISQEEAENSPFRHTITRAVGVAEHVSSQIKVVDHLPGDCYLLCSDGLTLHVSDDEIRQELEACYDPEQCVEHLIRKTLCGGARDNVTIIAVFA